MREWLIANAATHTVGQACIELDVSPALVNKYERETNYFCKRQGRLTMQPEMNRVADRYLRIAWGKR